MKLVLNFNEKIKLYDGTLTYEALRDFAMREFRL